MDQMFFGNQSTVRGRGSSSVLVQVTLRQLPSNTGDFRPLLKEVKKSQETRIVLDCDFDKIETILQQANEIELLTDYHNFLISSLDLDKISLAPYTDTVGGQSSSLSVLS